MKCKNCSCLNKKKKREALGCYQYGCTAHGWMESWINTDSLLGSIGCGEDEIDWCQMNIYDFPEVLP
ncbi:MAG: hypothetical protein H2212_03680 [Ruminococcus sp.]|nr:hypothetical protein [Ruminococcus sp.]